MSALLISLGACIQGNSLPPFPGVEVTVTDPDGVQWVTSEADIGMQRQSGPDCTTADWFHVSGGTAPMVSLWFPELPEGETADIGEAVWVVGWNIDSHGMPGGSLFGGQGTMVEFGPDRMEYQVDAGQDCVYDPAGDPWVCADQAVPVTFVIEATHLSELEPVELTGTAGFASSNGGDLCGSLPPGT